MANGESHERDWVIYSPSLQAVLCFQCKLFGAENQNIESFRTSGFNDWKNYNRAFKTHEQSQHHIQNCVSYRNQANETNMLDAQFRRQEQIEVKYWHEVLQKIVSVVKFLASRGLAFRGSDEILGSNTNGNYLGILELIAKHDPFLANHMEIYGNKGRGKIAHHCPTFEPLPSDMFFSNCR